MTYLITMNADRATSYYFIIQEYLKMLPAPRGEAVPTPGPAPHTRVGWGCGGSCRSLWAVVSGSGSSASFGAAADGGGAADFVCHPNLSSVRQIPQD